MHSQHHKLESRQGTHLKDFAIEGAQELKIANSVTLNSFQGLVLALRNGSKPTGSLSKILKQVQNDEVLAHPRS